MIDIPNVFATTYMDVKSSGRNRPCAFSCVNHENTSTDYIVKFYSSIGSTIICEFAATLLGKKLGINVPDIAIVHTDYRLAPSIRDRIARENFEKKDGPHFGSQYLGPGFTVMNKGYKLSSDSLEQALNIFAFDMLIQNIDRTAAGTVGNPNILYKGHQLFAIDHELSFSFVNLIGGNPDPWNIRGSNLAQRHVFYTQLGKHAKNNTICFDGFIEEVSALPDEYMESVMQALPTEWYNEMYAEKIITHINLIRSNIELFQKGLLEVFA